MSRVALSAWLSDLESGARPKGGIKDGVGEIPSLGAEHLADNGGFNFSKDKRIPRDFFQSMTKGRIRRNDILIVKDGATTGKVSFVGDDFPHEDAAINEHVFLVRVSNTLADPKFVFRYLQTPQGQSEIMSDFRGATVGGIGRTFVEKVTLPKVAVDEQRRIAAILDRADAIRRKRERALTLADDFLRSVFLEMFGDPRDNPLNHPVKNFDSLLSIPLRNGISPASRGTVTARVLTLTAITGDRFDASYVKEGKFLEPISEKDTVSTSDFYICRGNGSPDLIGKGFYADQNIPGTAFPDTMIAAKPNPKKVTRAFLESIWNGPFVRSQIREAARTTNGTFKINQTATGAIKIPVPPLEAQQRFQKIVDRVARSKEKVAFGADLFPALSQRAFAGEL